MEKVKKECLNCGENFFTYKKYINRGHGKYCSIKCSSLYTNKNKIKKEHNYKCHVCDTSFYRSKSKANSKSGYRFCSRKCKEYAQSLNGLNLKAIQPTHFGKAKIIDYRFIAFSLLDNKCNKCNYDKCIGILHVHHKDRNRENNDISNLEILCPTCHEEEHYLSKTGKWGQ